MNSSESYSEGHAAHLHINILSKGASRIGRGTLHLEMIIPKGNSYLKLNFSAIPFS